MSEPTDILIGLDAGTSVIKAVAFSLDGEQLAVASTSNRIEHVAGGGVEQDMNWTWQVTAQALRELSDKLPDLPRRTAAIAVTAQGDGTWLIDSDNQPVAPAWLWLDGRSGDIVADVRRSGPGEQLFDITGTGLNTSHQGGHLKWLKQHRPEVLKRAARSMHCKDWLYLNLCGEVATDPSEGVYTFGDYRTRAYDDRVLEILDLQDYQHLLPPIVDGTRHHGRLIREAATATGFIEGTPVVLAPVDFLCTGLGAGVFDRTRDFGCTIVGSTGIHMVVYHGLDEITPKNQVGFTIPFCVPGTWAGVMSNMAAALNLNWFLDCAEQLLTACNADRLSRDELLALLDRKAGEASPGSAIYHPFIFEAGERGPFVEPLARAQFLGMTTQTSMFDLVRAIYEGLGFAARDCYDGLSQRPPEVRLTGGMARSTVFRQVFASVVGAPVRVSRREECGAAGAAIVAAACLGHYDDVAAACPTWVDAYLDDTAQQPDPELTAIYDRMFEAYQTGYRQMPAFWQTFEQARRGE